MKIISLALIVSILVLAAPLVGHGAEPTPMPTPTPVGTLVPLEQQPQTCHGALQVGRGRRGIIQVPQVPFGWWLRATGRTRPLSVQTIGGHRRALWQPQEPHFWVDTGSRVIVTSHPDQPVITIDLCTYIEEP